MEPQLTESRAKYLLARVTVPITDEMGVLADFLTNLIPGLTFEEDATGRFDEVPAFIATQDGMEFILMGVPEGETGDEYVLEFECETNLPLDEFLDSDTGGFVRRFVGGKVVDERGFMDCSRELAQLLIESGIPGCKPILPIL
jgi:hypothetical protein